MENFIDIRKFQGESCYEINIDGLKRICPLYKIGSEIWIVGNEHICFGTDIEFTREIGRKLAEKLDRLKADCILTAEAKSLCIAYEVAQNLGHQNFAIARKSIKPYNTDYIFTEINSITSAKKEILYLDELNISRIKGKKIILLDDVISTGSTMLGLLELTKKSGARVCCFAAIWLEGTWPFDQFTKEFKTGSLIYMDILPIFASGNTYKELYTKKISIENKMKHYQ